MHSNKIIHVLFFFSLFPFVSIFVVFITFSIRYIHVGDTVTIRWFSFWQKSSIWKIYEQFTVWIVLRQAFCYSVAVQRKHVKWSIKFEIVKCKSSICVVLKVIFPSKYKKSNEQHFFRTCTHVRLQNKKHLHSHKKMFFSSFWIFFVFLWNMKECWWSNQLHNFVFVCYRINNNSSLAEVHFVFVFSIFGRLFGACIDWLNRNNK